MATVSTHPEKHAKPAQQPRPRLTAALPDATIIKWLYDMALIREFENRTAQAYQQAKIGGFCHLYTGQEALAVGTINAVEPDDPIVHAYRDHGHALARGMDPKVCMAEMFGKATGCAKGKGGSMHMFDKPHWFFGGHGIVGAQTPLGTGLAFAAKYELEVLKRALPNPGVPGYQATGGTGVPPVSSTQHSALNTQHSPPKKKVALTYLGDGALNQGALHEAMNLAGLYSLPVIYIVENNGYSMGTSIERGTTMAHDLRKKAEAYGIEGLIMYGFDVLDLYDNFKPLVDRCRAEQRPAFVDLKTYRYMGHSMSDPQKYRTKEEVEQYKNNDSIARLADHLMNERKAQDGRPVLSEDQFKIMQDEIKAIVRDAVEFAEASPAPDPATELYSDVMVNPMPGMSPIGEYVQGAKNPLV